MSIQKGFGAIRDAQKGTVANLKLKDGESAVIRFLQVPEEIVSVWEYTEQFGGRWHTITALPADQDPLKQAGKKASFKTYFLVANRSDNDKVMIFKASKTVGGQILGLLEEYGDLRKRDFKITRNGEKLSTTYQFFPRDPSDFSLADNVELPDIEEMVAPKTREEILALMNGTGGGVTDVADQTEQSNTKKDDGFPF